MVEGSCEHQVNWAYMFLVLIHPTPFSLQERSLASLAVVNCRLPVMPIFNLFMLLDGLKDVSIQNLVGNH